MKKPTRTQTIFGLRCILLVSIIGVLFSKAIPGWIKLPALALVLLFNLSDLWLNKRFKRKLDLRALTILWVTSALFLSLFTYTELSFRSLVSGVTREIETVQVQYVSLEANSYTSAQELKGMRLGILSDHSSVIGYQAPTTLNEQEKLDLSFKKYDSYLDLIEALIQQEVKLIVLPEGYKKAFSSIEELSDQLSQLHTVYTSEATQAIEVPTQNPDVLNIVLIGGDNPIEGSSTVGFNYDVIVLLSINFKTHESAILSIPRDSYVYNTCIQKKDKITHSGWYGAECLTRSLTKLLGIEIHNYLLIDFYGVIDVVNSVGGVTIDVPQVIDEQDEDRNFENMIHLELGVRNLNGREALAFLRHRHTLENGALGRSQNHQIFIQAMIQQLVSPLTFFRMGALFRAVKNSVITNLEAKDMYTYYEKGLNLLFLGQFKPTALNLTGSDAYIYTPSFGLNLYYFVLDKVSVDTVKESLQAIQNNE